MGTGDPTLDMLTAIRDAIAIVLGIAAIIGGIVGWRRRISPWARKVREFLSDWTGEPARPNVPERIGVMTQLERHGDQLTKHTEQLVDLDARMDKVESNSHIAAFNSVPNHGSSFADEILRQLESLHGRLDQIQTPPEKP